MEENKEVQEENIAEKEKKTSRVEVVDDKKALVSRSADFDTETQLINQAVRAAGRQATTLKEVVDVGVTGIALQNKHVIVDLKEKKERELKEDALAKVIASETARIEQETNRVLEEGRRQLADLNNQINEVRAVKDKLEQEADQNKAYFECHKSILKYAGCVQVMSVTYMKKMSVIGFLIMCLVKIVFSPLILTGLFIETLVDIIGGVTGTITHNAWKIIASLGLAILIVGIVIGAYFGITELIKVYL